MRSLRSSRLALIPLICLALALPALAQDDATGGSSQSVFGYQSWGVRGGVNIDPDQIFGGIHLDLGQIVSQLRLMPSLEIGLGDDQTLISLFAEVHWVFRNVQLNTPESAGIWRPYVGGGLGLIHRNWDNDHPHHRGSDTDLGLSALAGLDRQLKGGQHFLFEFALGLSDAPDFQLMVGYTF